MMLADFTFWDAVGSVIVFCFMIAAFTLVIYLFVDLFGRDDLSGWAKAGWTALLIFFPWLGALIYIIARPSALPADAAYRAPSAAGMPTNGGSPADEIASLVRLRDSGAITAQEFERLKSRAIAA
jgi:hypothetical protein